MKKFIIGSSIVMLSVMTAFAAGGDKGKAKTKAKAAKGATCTVDSKKCDPKDCPKNCDYSKCCKSEKKAK